MSRKFNHINLSYLENIADGDNRVIKEFIEIFLSQLPDFINGFDTAFNQRDWKTIASLAHKAKSSVILIGMEELGNVDLKNLELMAKYFRIRFLTNNNALSDKEKSELDNLQQNLKSYPAEKQTWLRNNSSEEFVHQIIQKFRQACESANIELNIVLEKETP